MFRKKHYVALGAVALVAVLTLSLPTRATSRLKIAFSSLFLPLFGLSNGAKELPPALTSDGLIGRVSAVYPHRAQIVLIGDPSCRVSGLVENPAHDIGILSASGPLDNSFAQLTYLSGNANLKAGQKVFTSGEGGLF